MKQVLFNMVAARRRISFGLLMTLLFLISNVAHAALPQVLDGPNVRQPVSTSAKRSSEAIQPSIGVLKNHVTVLASDTFEGREAGTRGGHAAAAYIVNQLRKASVSPIPGQGFLQEFGRGYRNVIAWIPGTDPRLRNEVIVVGAHFDHVGYGNRTNSNGQVGRIHNGADDNASGVSALIELARAFQQKPARRPLVVAFWDAEEKGLLGSYFWVSNPTINRKSIRFMFNTDMIGRLREDAVEICGTRTAPGLRRLMSEANQTEQLNLEFNWDIVKDSDHYPFVERAIPFLFFCTKKHPQYHHPDDDPPLLNYDGLQKVSRVLQGTVRNLANLSAIPAYRTMAKFETQRSKAKLDRIGGKQPSRLGITYLASRSEVGTILVRSVTKGGSADKAGLKPGDRIIEFDGQQLANKDLGAVVQTAVNPVPVVYLPNGSNNAQVVQLQLSGNPIRFGLNVRDDEAEPGTMIVVRLIEGLPAAKAGVKPRDRIHAINQTAFADGNEFWKLIAKNQSVTLTIERGGRIFEQLMEAPLLIEVPSIR